MKAVSYTHLDVYKRQEYVQLQGWIRTNRSSGKLGFIELNDGTYFRNVQLVYVYELKNFSEVEKYPTGAAVTVTGRFKLTPDGKQQMCIRDSLYTAGAVNGLSKSTAGDIFHQAVKRTW